MTIGDRIKERRNNLDMTPEDLAAILGKSRATIYRYENGDIKNLPTTILEPLAKALQTTPAYLMGWTDDYHDWEQIGNDEGIYPPKDYQGSYEDYVKFKTYEQQDNLIDNYYDTHPAENINDDFSSDFIAKDDAERQLLLLCRKAGEVSTEEKEAIIKNFEATINVYLKAKGLIKE